MACHLGRCLVAVYALFPATGLVAATIQGSATYRERMALPPDAVFEATVADVSRAGAAAAVIGRIALMPAGQVPIGFTVPYAEGLVQPGHRYGLRARITVAGRELFTTTQSYPVLTSAAGGEVRLMLQRVSQTEQSDRQLTNTYWKLTELNAAPVKALPQQREPHLILQRDPQRLAGSGGCNRLLGSYTLDGTALTFGKVASTMMACSDGLEQETSFFHALERVRSWKIHGDELEFFNDDGAVVARFVAVDLR